MANEILQPGYYYNDGKKVVLKEEVESATSGNAGGDLTGTYPSPQVQDLSIFDEEQGSILYFNGSNWVQLAPATDGYVLNTNSTGNNPTWELAQPQGPAGGDLSGNYPNPTIANNIIDNDNINSSAAIEYSKLDLSNSIVNADINNSANISYSKLDLSGSILNTDLAGFTLSQLNTLVSDATLDDSNDSRSPTGSAGGDLSGTYPNPQVAADIIDNNNNNINSSANIDVSKLDGESTDGYKLVTNSGVPAWQEIVLNYDHIIHNRDDLIAAVGSPSSDVFTITSGSYAFGSSFSLPAGERLSVDTSSTVYMYGFNNTLSGSANTTAFINIPSSSTLYLHNIKLSNDDNIFVIVNEGTLYITGCDVDAGGAGSSSRALRTEGTAYGLNNKYYSGSNYTIEVTGNSARLYENNSQIESDSNSLIVSSSGNCIFTNCKFEATLDGMQTNNADIIEFHNCEIITNTSGRRCLSSNNTDLFIVNGCTLHGAGGTTGILITNNNTTIQITNTKFYDLSTAINNASGTQNQIIGSNLSFENSINTAWNMSSIPAEGLTISNNTFGSSVTKYVGFDQSTANVHITGNTQSGRLPDTLTILNEAENDLLYFDGDNWVRLASGDDGYVLKSNNGVPEWSLEPLDTINILPNYTLLTAPTGSPVSGAGVSNLNVQSSGANIFSRWNIPSSTDQASTLPIFVPTGTTRISLKIGATRSANDGDINFELCGRSSRSIGFSSLFTNIVSDSIFSPNIASLIELFNKSISDLNLTAGNYGELNFGRAGASDTSTSLVLLHVIQVEFYK